MRGAQEAVKDSGTPGLRDWSPLTANDRIGVIGGFAGPESVRYDAEQDLVFVSNFNGPAGQRDGNGFISRVTADGVADSLHFAVGTAVAPMHSPRGMILTGDTLWAVDLDAVHGFDRRSGAHLGTISLAAFDPGFPNDIAMGPDGALYVTDTGKSRIYRIAGGTATLAEDDPKLTSPNGITWDPAGRRFLVAPWNGDHLLAWTPDTGTIARIGSTPGGLRDGVELVEGRILVTSQRDSTVQVVTARGPQVLAHLPGAPADLGIDTKRRRMRVPYVDRNEVEIWGVPKEP